MNDERRPLNNFLNQVRRLPISAKITLLVTIFPGIIAVLIGIYLSHLGQQHLNSSLLNQARALFNQIQIVRHWNAGYGGVYVFKTPEMKTNPYLYKMRPHPDAPLPIEPEIKDNKGRVLVLKNPALMTRELSEIAEEKSNVRFHITSLKLINPGNKPDVFEEKALKEFEKSGVQEMTTFESYGDIPYFRYMAPLKITKPCLKCHGFQGYKEGDIRGGISVSLSVGEELVIREKNFLQIIFVGISVYLLTVGTLVFSLRKLVTEPVRKLKDYTRHMGSSEAEYDKLLPCRLDEIGTLSQALQTANHEIMRQQQELERRAEALDLERRVDPLTEVYNRQHFQIEMPGLFNKVNNEGLMLSLLMIDLDHFKQINDMHGHDVGDQVLRSVSRKLMDSCRAEDLVIRFGGEEFVIVLPGLGHSEAVDVAERIRSYIENSHFRVRKVSKISCTVSIGVSSTDQCDSIENLLLCADKALYRAKNNGRNRVESGSE